MSDLKRILRRHHHLVTFSGAALVFLTFAAKDGVREQLKDLVASLDTAENMYVLRQANQFTDSQVAELARNFKEFSEESHKTKTDAEWFAEKFENKQELVQVELVGLADRINNMEKILRKAPDLQDEQELRQLKQRVLEAHDKWSACYKARYAGPQSAPVLAKLILDLGDIELVAAKLSLSITLLEGRVLDQARELKNSKEENYKWATWVSWLLYTLGLGIALIGRIYGVEGIGEGE